MNELQQIVWIEKYRPATLDSLICQHKSIISKYLNEPKTIPNFIFYSNSPGTGKTSTAKLIAKILDCDLKVINASAERGIDIVRDEVRKYSCSLSSNTNCKRCVFMDESDGLCLDGNTEIITKEGISFVNKKIKDLINKNIEVLSYDNEKTEIVIDNGIGISSGGTEVYEVELEDGRKVICSKNHPFFITKDGIHIIEKKLKNLKKGDSIVEFGDYLQNL